MNQTVKEVVQCFQERLGVYNGTKYGNTIPYEAEAGGLGRTPIFSIGLSLMTFFLSRRNRGADLW